MAMRDLSKNNPYALSHFRTLELKYFCLQYPEWEKEIKSINLYLKGDDPTGDIAVKLSILNRKCELIKKCCKLVGDEEGLIFEGVTEGRSYYILEARRGTLPFARWDYYERYRRFMYILSSQVLQPL